MSGLIRSPLSQRYGDHGFRAIRMMRDAFLMESMTTGFQSEPSSALGTERLSCVPQNGRPPSFEGVADRQAIPTLVRMVEYEVRLFKSDGTLAVLVKVPASRDAEACIEASHLINGNIASATVWLDRKLIRTLYSDQTG